MPQVVHGKYWNNWAVLLENGETIQCYNLASALTVCKQEKKKNELERRNIQHVTRNVEDNMENGCLPKRRTTR